MLHERHGLAKARHALETLNYKAEKVSLLQQANGLAGCGVLVVAGPKVPLLPAEVEAIRAYLVAGGNALFLLDPFVATGLEPVIREYGIVVDDDIVIDEASHFWADVSSPGGQRLQPAPDHPRPAAHLLPGRALALPHPAARPRHLGGPAPELLEEQLGADQPRTAWAS